MSNDRSKQHGFSLVEMLMVLAIFTIVSGVVFGHIMTVQQRYKTESARVDVQQEAREFMDQLVRDLHTAGYPNYHMYNGGLAPTLNPPNLAAENARIAVGLVAVSSSDIYFEGDVAGDGNVHSIHYTLQTTVPNQCPCTLSRSDVGKVAGSLAYPWDQGTSYATEVQNLVNSVGQANGNVPYVIAGNTPWAGVTNDAFYGTYKTAPVFEFLDKNGNLVAGVPPDLSTAANKASGVAAAGQVTAINIVINVVSPSPDQKTGLAPAASMRATVKINNL